MKDLTRTFPVLLLVLSFSFLAACGSANNTRSTRTEIPVTSKKPSPPVRGQRLVSIASSLLGAPYRYGGISPRGFDCSGLVYFTHKKAGIDIPRSTSEQYRDVSRIRQTRLLPGDLVFFRISAEKVSHVGIYKGKNQFIHAPSSGKKVTISSLDNPYWQNRYVGSGRYYRY